MIIKENAAQSGHWYSKDGSPAYTIIGKNGKERSTTLKDAREHGLVPSVTTILGQIAKPGLDAWKQRQVLLSALTLPREAEETEDSWIERIMYDSKETGKKAAERGTKIHGDIESYFIKGNSEIPYVMATATAIFRSFGSNRIWRAEKSFYHSLGFGGKSDLISDNLVIDIKTTEKDPFEIEPFFEQAMQLAAYREGFGMPDATCANVYVNALTNQVHVAIHSEEKIKQAWKCFCHLVMFYKDKNNLLTN
jgi:hypothetical protein